MNSHLAAHVGSGYCQRRNQDYSTIKSKLEFKIQDQQDVDEVDGGMQSKAKDPGTKSSSNDDLQFDGGKLSRPGSSAKTTRTLTLKDHDIIFWMGDLNYRINVPDIPVERMRAALDSKNDQAAYLRRRLLEADELKFQRDFSLAFEEYNEAHIKFLPTYKYDPGTDRWDSSSKNRAPAWCDRILVATFTDAKDQEKYRYFDEVTSKNGAAEKRPDILISTKSSNRDSTDSQKLKSSKLSVRQISYTSHPQLKLSDHKPISAQFIVQIPFDMPRSKVKNKSHSLPKIVSLRKAFHSKRTSGSHASGTDV